MKLKFWKHENEVAQAIDRLIEQLTNLEQAKQESQKQLTELLTNPEQLASLFQTAISATQIPSEAVQPRIGVGRPATIRRQQALLPAPEAIKDAIDTVTKAILAKMEEMEKHISTAVSELPPDVLGRIAEKVKAGEDFSLRRRHGCIYIDFGYGDDDYWLKL